jgi:hypothetical protein
VPAVAACAGLVTVAVARIAPCAAVALAPSAAVIASAVSGARQELLTN